MIRFDGGAKDCTQCQGSGLVLSAEHVVEQCGCVLRALDVSAAKADRVITKRNRKALEAAGLVVVPSKWVIR